MSGIRMFALVLVLLLAVMAPGASAQRVAPATLWSGVSGGYQWRWTAADITAEKGGRRFSLKQHLLRTAPRPGPEKRKYEYNWSVRPLSLVGTLLCYEVSTYEEWEGAVHPWQRTSYRCVDVRRPDARPVVTDYFPTGEVAAALGRDALVRRALGGLKPPTRAQALAKLLDGRGDEEGRYQFQADMLARFAFHHLESGGGRVAVRFGLSHLHEVHRGNLTQVGVLLSTPPALRDSLRRAADGREGFLSRELLRRFPDRYATWGLFGPNRD